MGSDEFEVDLKQLRRNVTSVNASLMQFQNLTDSMVGILDSFETRLTELETIMIPIHKQTQSLTLAQKNIDKTLEEVESVRVHFETIHIDESELGEREASENLDSFLQKLLRINDAAKFFSANASFQNSQKALRQLNSTQKKALRTAEFEFKATLESDSEPVDFTELSWPLPDDLELVSRQTLSRLGHISSALWRCGSDAFMAQLIEIRSATLCASLQSSFVFSGEAGSELEVERIAKKVKSAIMGKKKPGAELYQRGSHPFIQSLHFFLWLLKLERKLCVKVFEETGAAEAKVDDCFDGIVRDASDLLVKETEELCRRKSKNKMLVLLDLLSTLNELQPKFEELHREGTASELDKLLVLSTKLTSGFRKALEQSREKMAAAAARQVPVDGGYDTLTVATVITLKQLFEYRSTMQAAMPTEEAMNTALMQFLVSLEAAIESKAKTYKNSCLAQVFLLNNYHYLLKSVTSRELEPVVDSDTIARYRQCFRSARENYKNSSWLKALSYIDVKDAEALVGSGASLSSSAKKAIKAKFHGFNQVFEELYSTQKHFSVPDPDLRSQLRNTNVELVVPRYHTFLERFSYVEFSTHTGKYVKYSGNVLEQMLNKFFDEEA